MRLSVSQNLIVSDLSSFADLEFALLSNRVSIQLLNSSQTVFKNVQKTGSRTSAPQGYYGGQRWCRQVSAYPSVYVRRVCGGL